MSWIYFLLENPGAVLGSVLIVLWGLAAACAMTSGSGLVIELAVLLFYWIAQGVLLGHMDGAAGLPWGFLIGDIVFVSWIVWDGLLSSKARKSRTQEKNRQAAIDAIAARGGFTDPRRNRQAD